MMPPLPAKLALVIALAGLPVGLAVAPQDAGASGGSVPWADGAPGAAGSGGGVQITPSQQNATAFPGGSVQYNWTLTNHGPGAQDIRLNETASGSGWDASLSLQHVRLRPGQSVAFYLTVQSTPLQPTVPSLQSHVVITAMFENDPEVYDQAVARTRLLV